MVNNISSLSTFFSSIALILPLVPQNVRRLIKHVTRMINEGNRTEWRPIVTGGSSGEKLK